MYSQGLTSPLLRLFVPTTIFNPLFVRTKRQESVKRKNNLVQDVFELP